METAIRAKILVSILLMILLGGCSGKERTTQNEQDKNVKDDAITIAATFYPLYDLTKSIVGEKGIVYSIVPAGVEPHDYEPNPSDLKKSNSADAFVTLGVEFSEFEDNLLNSIGSDVKVISAGEGISLLRSSDESGDDSNFIADNPNAGNDPHIWLSPKNAQKMVLNIMDGLSELKPADRELYIKNGQEVINKLKSLDAEFKEGLASCSKKSVFVNHNAFAYLARDYGFELLSVSGLEPEIEPTPQQLAKLVQEAKKHNIKYIFYEELADSRVARTIADEIGAQVLELDSIEGTNNQFDNYFTLSRKNLKNLRTALECK